MKMIGTRSKEFPRRTLPELAPWARPCERLGREHYRGYGVMALPFDSGHVLALRVMPWNDFEPFEAVWHRTPEGRWQMYVQAEEPDRLCPRLFGPALSGWRPADIDVSWPDERTLHVRMERPDLDWTVRLRSSALTRLANRLLPRIPPEIYRRRWCTSMVGFMAKHALGLGPLDLRGVLPGGQDVLIQPSRLYLVGASRATLMGRDLGAPVRADVNPTTGSFRWPALGVLAGGDIHVGIGDRKEATPSAGTLSECPSRAFPPHGPEEDTMTERRFHLTDLPVGFENFHKQEFINYQLNRAHALGYAETHRLHAAATQIRNFDDCVEVFKRISAEAAEEGKLRHAASYLRLVEFFTPQFSDAKVDTYKRYRALFDLGFADTGAVRHEVPYEESTLPAYKLPSLQRGTRGTVLLHGGFDSVIEEFYPIWERIAAAGYDVMAFEGPGQGGARTLNGLTFDHDWEKAVAAVLDHFNLERATLIGISMGGYWAIRAAGREPRIDRVVSWPPVYDWMHRVPAWVRAVARGMFKWRGFMNWSVGLRARLVPMLRHVVNQAAYLVDGDQPMDAVDWFLGMNAEHLGSERVTQDVLLLSGENDTFQPPILTRKQAQALVNARSVAVRTFTRDERADSHCQMGNLDLATRVVTTWLREGRLETRAGTGEAD